MDMVGATGAMRVRCPDQSRRTDFPAVHSVTNPFSSRVVGTFFLNEISEANVRSTLPSAFSISQARPRTVEMRDRRRETPSKPVQERKKREGVTSAASSQLALKWHEARCVVRMGRWMVLTLHLRQL